MYYYLFMSLLLQTYLFQAQTWPCIQFWQELLSSNSKDLPFWRNKMLFTKPSVGLAGGRWK